MWWHRTELPLQMTYRITYRMPTSEGLQAWGWAWWWWWWRSSLPWSLPSNQPPIPPPTPPTPPPFPPPLAGLWPSSTPPIPPPTPSLLVVSDLQFGPQIGQRSDARASIKTTNLWWDWRQNEGPNEGIEGDDEGPNEGRMKVGKVMKMKASISKTRQGSKAEWRSKYLCLRSFIYRPLK